MIWKDVKGENLVSFKILSQNLAGGPEERHENVNISGLGLRFEYLSPETRNGMLRCLDAM
jgi:hypothetical protein